LRGGDDLAAFRDRGGDRLLDQHVDVLGDAGERDLVMQMGGRCDGDGIDPGGEKLVERLKALAVGKLAGARQVRRRGIDHADESDAG
jgi:hypothetical protein